MAMDQIFFQMEISTLDSIDLEILTGMVSINGKMEILIQVFSKMV